MSVSGLNQQYLPNTLDGLNVIEADQVYIDGQLVNLSDYVTYENASRTLNMGVQNIQTSHDATTGNDVVNKTHLDNVVSNLSIAIAGSFLDKTTATPQSVVGNVSYTAQLSADDLVVPTTKTASLGGVLTVGANYRRAETDATVSIVQYFGSISSSMGVYQATTTQNFAILQVADLGTGIGKRMDINWNLNINEALYNSSIQLFASDNGTNLNQYLSPSVSFVPSDSLYKVMTGTFIPQYRYICVLCITAKPSGVQTVRWYGLQLEEQGVDITALTMSAQGASQIPILNDKKQLVGSGVSSSKVVFLDNVSSDIQTQLNSKLNLSGSNANQDIVLGGYKVQSSATPTTGNDYTNKSYVDGAITGAGALYLQKAGDTATGTIFNSGGDFHAYRGGDTNRGCILTAYNNDGATYASNNGGLASWFGISYKSTYDNTTRYVFNTRDGNSSQTGTMTANGVIIDGQTASRVCVLDASKNVVSSTVTSTTLSYLDIGSSLTGLLNAKGNLSGGNTWSGDQTFNSAVITISTRLLGEPDAPTNGNFWMGLRGSASEVDRLAISIVGNQTTGLVSRVSIPKILRLSQPTANRVLTLDANGDVVSSSVTPTVLGYLDIGSSLTGLLNAKANLAGPQTFTGTHTFSAPLAINLSAYTGNRVLTIDASKNVTFSTTTTTELDYLSGTTSSVQTQLNGKLNDTGDTATGIIRVSIANTYAQRASNPLSSNFVAESSSQRLYMGSYYTAGEGACSTIQASDYYSSADHGDNLLINPLGGAVGFNQSSPQYVIHASRTNGYDASVGGYSANKAIGVIGIGGKNDDPDYQYLLFPNPGKSDNSIPGVYWWSSDMIVGRYKNEFRLAWWKDTHGSPLGTAYKEGITLFLTDSSGYTTLDWIKMTGKVGIGTTASPSQLLYVNGTGAFTDTLTIGISGLTANTTPNLIFSSSAQHVDNGAGQVYLFSAINGHIGIQRNTTRNATTACLALGTADTEESQVISYKADGSGYMPLSYAGSVHTWVAGNSTDINTTSYTFRGQTGYDGSNFVNLQCQASQYGRNQLILTGRYEGDNDAWSFGGARNAIRFRTQSSLNSAYTNRWTIQNYADKLGILSSDTPTMVFSGSSVGIGTTNPSGRLDIYSTTASYDNGLVIRTPWAGIFMDNTQLSGGRKWAIFSGGTGAGIGLGNLGFWDETSAAYRLGISSVGRVAVRPNGADFPGLFSVYNAGGEDFVTLHNSTFAEGQYINQRFLFGSTTGTNRSAYVQAYKINNEARLLFYTSDSSGGVNNRLTVRDNGIDVEGNANIIGNVSAATYSAVNATVTTYQNTSNRLLFRDGSGALTVGACSFWRYTSTSVAWTYGVGIANAFYVPSTTATIQIQITGSGYSTFVGSANFNVLIKDSTGMAYTSAVPFYFNQTYVHTQATQHITIPNNFWGANTIGYKDIELSWATALYIQSDSNDTLQLSIAVIG